MTPDLPISPDKSPEPAKTDSRARRQALFLLCDRRSADVGMIDARLQSGLLHRLGLTDGANAVPLGMPVPLTFAGMRIDLLQGEAACSALDAVLADSGASASTSRPTLGGDEMVFALALNGQGERPAHDAQRLCAVAALIGPLLGARHIYWPPAALWSDADRLADAVIAMESSGIPPILHLVAFAIVADDAAARHHLSTRGLAWFGGFELAVEAPSAMSPAQLLRRAARLAIDAMLNGDPLGPIELPGLEPGETVSIGALRHEGGSAILPTTIDSLPST